MSSPAERPIERAVCVYCASRRLAHPDYPAAARAPLEALLEPTTPILLGLSRHPIVLVTTRGFFTALTDIPNRAAEARFMAPRPLMMWQVVGAPEEVPGALPSAPAWSAQARSFAA